MRQIKRRRLAWAMLFLALALLGGLLDSASPEAFGQEKKKSLYFPQLAVGGGEVLENGTVIDGWEFVYSVMNINPELWIMTDFLFWVREMPSPPQEFRFLDREAEFRGGSFTVPVVNENGTGGLWGVGFPLNSFNRKIRVVTAAPFYRQGLATGWMEFRYPVEAEGLLVSTKMTFYSAGRAVSAVEVPAVEARNENFIQIFVAEKDRQQPGIAIANPSDAEAVVTLRLIKEAGEFSKKEIKIGAKGHFSKFFSELFPEFTKDAGWEKTKTFGGILKISSPVKIPVLAINTRVVEGVGFLMSTLAAK